MPRKNRIEEVGFYHVVNRGVARGNVYLSDEDYFKFLDIVQDASDEYSFEVYSFSLMGNHYHLLLKTTDKNLSRIMQKINSRYSIYFNNKYKRVGPLWQGRFKAWFVFDEGYLQVLVKYIEANPVKANITDYIGQYPWSMSTNKVGLAMLNFEIIEKIDFSSTDSLNKEEQNKLSTFLNTKLKIQEDEVVAIEKPMLESHFENQSSREEAIYCAIKAGFTQKEIGKYLGLSNVAISKTAKTYRQKINLFEYLRDKGIFWSYSKSISYQEIGDILFVEYLLKYGDFYDIKLAMVLFGKRYMKKVWEKRLKSDKSFIKTNLMLARVFFDMNVESDYFKEAKNERLEKFKLLAS